MVSWRERKKYQVIFLSLLNVTWGDRRIFFNFYIFLVTKKKGHS